MKMLRGKAKEPSPAGPWSAPRPEGPLALALSRAQAQRAQHRQDGHRAEPLESPASSSEGDELSRGIAALAREAEARDPARLVGNSLRREGRGRSRSRGSRGASGASRLWHKIALATGLAALTAIVLVWSSPSHAPAPFAPDALRLDHRLSTPHGALPGRAAD
jgi:hypothetical protein